MDHISHPVMAAFLLLLIHLLHSIIIWSISCLNFWDEAWWSLSLRVFGLLSFPQHFFWTIVISTTLRTIYPLAFFRCYLYCYLMLPCLTLSIISRTRLQSGVNLKSPDDCLLRSLGNRYAMCPAGQFRVNFWDL